MAKSRIEGSPARRVGPAAEGEGSGMVEVKTRLPIHLHIALSSAAERNLRSLSSELRLAAQQHVEREARR